MYLWLALTSPHASLHLAPSVRNKPELRAEQIKGYEQKRSDLLRNWNRPYPSLAYNPLVYIADKMAKLPVWEGAEASLRA